MRLALYQPDIPQNAGTLLRLGACLGISVDIIEPCGFLFSDAQLRRAGVPGGVHDRATARLRIPLKSGLRSINVAQAGAMALGEALRQTGTFPS